MGSSYCKIGAVFDKRHTSATIESVEHHPGLATDRAHREAGLDMEEQKHKAEALIIVYGTNKHLKVQPDETIEQVKLGGMELFSIPTSDQGSFVLKAKIEGHEVQLEEAKTVEDYHLHQDQKVTLAAGTPFGHR